MAREKRPLAARFRAGGGDQGQARTGGIKQLRRCPAAQLAAIRQERQLVDWLQRFNFHQVVLSHRGGPAAPPAARPQDLPPPSSRGPCRRPGWLAAYLERLQREAGRHCAAGEQSSGELIAPELALRQGHDPLRPAGGLVGRRQAGRAGPRRSSGSTWAAPPPMCSICRGRRPGSEDGRGRWRLQRKLAWSGWRRRRSPVSPAGGKRLPIHTVAAGVARGSTFDASDCRWAGPRPGDPGPALLPPRRAASPSPTPILLLGRTAAGGPFRRCSPRRDQRARSGAGEASCSRSWPSGSPWRRDGRARLEALAEGALAIRPTDRMAEAIRRISESKRGPMTSAVPPWFSTRAGGPKHALPLRPAAGHPSACWLHPRAGAALGLNGIAWRPPAAWARRWCVKPPMRRWWHAAAASAALVGSESRPQAEFSVGVRLAASELTLRCPGCGAGPAAEAFERAHRQRFRAIGPRATGQKVPDLGGEWLLVELVDPGPNREAVAHLPSASPQRGKRPTLRLYWGGEWARRSPCTVAEDCRRQRG